MYIHLLSSFLEHDDDATLHSTLHFQSNGPVHMNERIQYVYAT